MQKTDQINGDFKGKDILSVDQFSASDLEILFKQTEATREIAQNNTLSDTLKGTVTTLLFYEPSSRTFASFSASVKRLGGQTVEILNPKEFSSVAKGETLEDTIRTLECYSDAIVIRHPEAGSAQKAADAAFFVPVLNAGDGTGEHPTQALLDLFTIYEKTGRLEGLTGVMAGDMLNGRTVHSLLRGLSLYKANTMYLLSPKELHLPEKLKEEITKRGVTLHEIESEKDMPKDANFWYWTRVQKERFEDIRQYEEVKNRFIVTPELLNEYGNEGMILMHPLPRVGEIETTVDSDPRAVYLRQEMQNGMYVRMALMALILGRTL